MERLIKDVQTLKSQIFDMKEKYNYIISLLEDKNIIESEQKKQEKLDKKRKQLFYPFFTEQLETFVGEFKDCDKISIMMQNNQIVLLRLINSIAKVSQNIQLENPIPVEFPIVDDSEIQWQNILVRRAKKNVYYFLSGDLKAE